MSTLTKIRNIVPFMLNDVSLSCLHKAYTERHRYYHNLEHILSVCEYLDEHLVYQSYVDQCTVFMAALYHDFYYVVGSKDNEKHSAYSAVLALDANPGMKVDALQVKRLINLTALHTEDQHVSRLEGIFLDADLHTLGNEDSYKHSQTIKQECLTACSPMHYNVGRKQFLTAMLARKQIFYLDRWREQTARLNLQIELDMLV